MDLCLLFNEMESDGVSNFTAWECIIVWARIRIEKLRSGLRRIWTNVGICKETIDHFSLMQSDVWCLFS